MAMSYGQHSGDGHSHGPLGHGGVMHLSLHGVHDSESPHAQVHVNDPRGHTMEHEHGGTFNVGCC